ncbi:hypothetical protein [Planctomycetes bacterium K23_9]
MQTQIADAQDFGPSLGVIESTSEKVQLVICGVAVVTGFAASMLKESPTVMFATVLGIGLAVFVCYLVCKKTRRFSERLEVFPEGVRLNLRGTEDAFRFTDLREFKISETDHHANGMYIGTRARLHFVIDGRIRPISCELEHKRHKSTGGVMARLAESSVAAIRNHLSSVLESEGELLWTPEVYLTMDALRIHDGPNGNVRSIPIEDITQCTVADNQMKFAKCGEAMPFLVLSTDHVNFFSIAELFRSLHACYRQEESVASASSELHLQSV